MNKTTAVRWGFMLAFVSACSGKSSGIVGMNGTGGAPIGAAADRAQGPGSGPSLSFLFLRGNSVADSAPRPHAIPVRVGDFSPPWTRSGLDGANSAGDGT
jgi:hypothetical protein